MTSLSRSADGSVLEIDLHSGMAPPTQERSRQSLDRLLHTLERLLEKQSFESISIADLSRAANVSVGSIYARFADKQALLLGMHRLIHERSEPCRRRLVAPARWRGRTIDAVLKGVIVSGIRYYRQHGKVMRAVSQCATPEMARQVGGEVAAFIEMMTELLMTKAPGSDPKALNKAVAAAVRSVMSVLIFRTVYMNADAARAVGQGKLSEELLIVARAFIVPAIASRRHRWRTPR